jgi:hypothetical protein
MCSNFSIVLKLNDMPSTGTREGLPLTFFSTSNINRTLRGTGDGLVAGTDGSVDKRSEQMGAGYVLGDQPEPILTFHARVGGPLATTRAEAASILKLLQDVRMSKGHGVNLLVFVDCLVVLDILSKWGRTDFYPDPKEVVHFDVIRHLLMELRQWS